MWNNLEHEFLKQIKELSTETLAKDCFFIFAVSGGEDSMVLLHLGLNVLKNKNFVVAHAHHGNYEVNEKNKNNVHTLTYRDEAQNYIKNFCFDQKINFYHERTLESLTSENRMREFRYNFLFRLREKLQADSSNQKVVVVTAHHSLDQLETQIMNLIRGCGLEGLRAMKIYENYIFRPLLQVSKVDIKNYIKEKKIHYLQDPSNIESDYFRNWIRNEWLNTLEQKNPGSLKRVQESLSLISADSMVLQEAVNQFKNKDNFANGISREQYDFSLKTEQRHLLYNYCNFVLRQVNSKSSESKNIKAAENPPVTDFTSMKVFISRGQIEEIQKYLDKSQKELTFTAIGLKWVVNAKQIIAIKE